MIYFSSYKVFSENIKLLIKVPKNQACPTIDKLSTKQVNPSNESCPLCSSNALKAVRCIIISPMVNIINIKNQMNLETNINIYDQMNLNLSILYPSYHKKEACRYGTPHIET